VRCDGLVVCTPAGSTGYNLANGGPVLAWGVEGYGVSFIAPHSLTARALVVAPDDELTVLNQSQEPVDVTIDGRPVGEIGAGERMSARFQREASVLAQVPGSSFYRRLREKFGRPQFVTDVRRLRHGTAALEAIRRRPLVDRGPCSSSSASRTSCSSSGAICGSRPG